MICCGLGRLIKEQHIWACQIFLEEQELSVGVFEGSIEGKSPRMGKEKLITWGK